MPGDERRLTRSSEEPIVGGLPDAPGILTALRLTPELGVHFRARTPPSAGFCSDKRVTSVPG
jgi:hypothetical protein